MKKLFVVMSFIALGLGTVFAQKGQKAVGVHLGYGTGIENLGIGAKFQYNFTDVVRAEAALDYFFKKNYNDMWDVNLNVQYLFPLPKNFTVYPVAGLTLASQELDSSTRLGINLGAGVEYAINSDWSVNFDAKYQILKHIDQAVFNLGIACKF